MEYRKAQIADGPDIHKLVNAFADSGMMLAKPLFAIYDNIREYVLAVEDGVLIGVGGLHILWSDLAEIRSLAVRSDYQGAGIGAHIVHLLENEARQLGISRIFALTYQERFFLRCGFQQIDHKELPHKVWTDCINCPKFPGCDEAAVIKILESIKEEPYHEK